MLSYTRGLGGGLGRADNTCSVEKGGGVNQSSLSTDGARGALLEDATARRVEVDASFSAASAASIHSE